MQDKPDDAEIQGAAELAGDELPIARSSYRTDYSFVTPDIARIQNDYINDWHVRHNQLLMIQDQYMPRGRTY